MEHNHNEENDFENIGKEEKENIEKMVDEVLDEVNTKEETTTSSEEDTSVEVNYADGEASEENIEEEIDETTKMQQELGDVKNKYLRLFAEFDNFKKRTAKERVELMKTAGQSVIRDILPVLDDFERAMKALDIDKDNPQKEDEGMRLIYHKLLRNLGNQGLKQMEVMGEVFDADLHEAITDVPGDESMKGKIIDVIEQGYYLNDKIIRYAKVVIGR